MKRRAQDIQDLHEAQLAVLDWLCDFDAIDDEQALFAMLKGCEEELPPDVCGSLGLDEGSSFGDGVIVVGGEWAPQSTGGSISLKMR